MTHGIVTAPQPEAVEVGSLILRDGGNAVDAAISSALVQTVVDPMMCGIAGFGSLQLYIPEKNFHGFIDFHTTAPSSVKEDMWEDQIAYEARDGFGFILKNRANEVGYESIMTPGTLKGFYEAIQEFGTMPWADIIQPAIDFSEEGFTISPAIDEFWVRSGGHGKISMNEKLRQNKMSRKIFLDEEGNPYPIGTRIKNIDMKQTLELIKQGGADVLYSGEIAKKINDDMKSNGGFLSGTDLKDYKTIRNEPLWGNYKDLKISTNQPPGGGIMVIQMLNILEHFDLKSMGHNSSEYIATVAEAMKYATIDKDSKVGDPLFTDVPIEQITDANYAFKISELIKQGEKANIVRYGAIKESEDTTHMAVMDDSGNIASMTHSLGMPSGIITKELGFMYNGCMSSFDPRPGMPASIKPGKRRFTGMSPTIVFKDDNPYIIVGAPGGTYITMGILQTLLNVIEFDMNMQEAVSAPRFTANSNAIDVTNRIPRFITKELEAKGYEVIRNPFSYGFAGVHGIRVKDGIWDGGADPGRDGMVLIV